MKVAVQLVVWNGEKYLANLFTSLAAQTFTNWELFVIDNSSIDHSATIIQTETKKFTQPVHTFFKNTNTGFATPHQDLFTQSVTPYVFVLNQDVVLEPDTLKKMVQFADENPRAASISPLLMRLECGQKTNIVDSLGLKITRSRKVLELGAGQSWSEKNTFIGQTTQVFGVSAVAVLYRRSAATKAGGLFNPDFFAYKEDIDLAWRLQLVGYEAVVLNDVIVYHDRSGRPNNSFGVVTELINKRKQSALIRYYSYKNHLTMLKTCEQWQNTLLDLPWILWYEVSKLIYFLLFDWYTFGGIVELWRHWKQLQLRRQQVQKAATVSWRQMRKWWK
jgi:GT2 family glycosyltransferase